MCQRGISISKNSSEVAVGRLKEEDKKESVLNLLKTLASGDLVYEPLTSTPREPYVSVVTLFSGTIIIFFNLLYNHNYNQDYSIPKILNHDRKFVEKSQSFGTLPE